VAYRPPWRDWRQSQCDRRAVARTRRPRPAPPRPPDTLDSANGTTRPKVSRQCGALKAPKARCEEITMGDRKRAFSCNGQGRGFACPSRTFFPSGYGFIAPDDKDLGIGELFVHQVRRRRWDGGRARGEKKSRKKCSAFSPSRPMLASEKDAHAASPVMPARDASDTRLGNKSVVGSYSMHFVDSIPGFQGARGGKGERVETKAGPLTRPDPLASLHPIFLSLSPINHTCLSLSLSLIQSAIQTDGFRSLREGEAVEFEVEAAAPGGRSKAVRVTGPEGAPVQVRGKRRKRMNMDGW